MLIIILYMVPIPCKKVSTALEIDTEKHCIIKEHTVVFNGYYHINVGDDVFSGKIKISGYEPMLQEWKLLDVHVSAEGRRFNYRYQGKIEDGLGVRSLGEIYSRLFLNKCMIVLFKEGKLTTGGSYSAVDARCIVMGVEKYEEAEAIVYDYLS